MRSGHPVVLLVDAIDVAATRANQNPLALPRVLPRGAFIVVSTRPGTSIVTTSPRTVISLSAANRANVEDLTRYVEQESAAEPLARRLREAGVEPEGFTRSVVDGSGGVWIIASHLLDEVRRGHRLAGDVDAPIPSLWHFYRATVFAILDEEPADLPVVALFRAQRPRSRSASWSTCSRLRSIKLASSRSSTAGRPF